MDTSKEYIFTQHCSKCGFKKHLYDFSKDNSHFTGRRRYCKRCQSLYNIGHPVDKSKYPTEEYGKRYRIKDKYKIKHRKDAKKHRKKYPHKVKARLAGQVLPKQPCEICGTTKLIEAHHYDYSKPHKVNWFCRKHHPRGHKKEGKWMLAQNT